MDLNQYEHEENIDTVLGDDIYFKGILKFKKSLKIKGKMDGNIEDSGVLVVGEHARVTGNINANDVMIEGTHTGNITAKHSIEINKHARLKGDLKAPDLRIHSGSVFNGKCEMETL